MTRIIEYLRWRWRIPGGYREMLTLAFPLILSTGALSVQMFVDRMFLTWYSPEAIAASSPASMMNFTIMSLFFGTAAYVTTFVAQYSGAGRDDRIGPIVWQGLYVAGAAAAANFLIIFLAGPMFDLIGHDPAVRVQEVRYFQVLCAGAGPLVASNALAGFFSGRGITHPVMWVNVTGTAVNIVLDNVLIFGRFGFPELGITGAGIATVISYCMTFLVYMVLLARPEHRERYRSLGGWRFNRALFGRLLRYGLPNGVQFFLDVAGFTVFILMVGRLGTAYLAATNIAFNINTIAFFPMLGAGMAVSVMVGRHIGAGEPDIAERSAYSGFHLTLFYMLGFAALCLSVPDLFIGPFAAQAAGGGFGDIRTITVVLLRFVAFYSLFDALNIIGASAIKGAGDTAFVMVSIAGLSVGLLVVPVAVAFGVFHASVYVAWGIATAYISVLGSVFYLRFLTGKWKSMRVIEPSTPAVPAMLPEAPVLDIE